MSTLNASNSNLCSRCGKARVVVKTWKEKSPSGNLVYSITACPDPECQKIVDSQLRKDKAKRDAQKVEAQYREQARKENIALKRAQKLAL